MVLQVPLTGTATSPHGPYGVGYSNVPQILKQREAMV